MSCVYSRIDNAADFDLWPSTLLVWLLKETNNGQWEPNKVNSLMYN